MKLKKTVFYQESIEYKKYLTGIKKNVFKTFLKNIRSDLSLV